MGCSIFKASSSSYDQPKEVKKAPNPDPKKCQITNHKQIGYLLIVVVKYDGCNTFEGSKVLVYTHVGIETIASQLNTVGLDPHFSENKKYHSPVARFRPDSYGMEMAIRFCNANLVL